MRYDLIIASGIGAVGLALASRHIYRGLQGHAGAIYEGMLRSALVSNFSRFGNLDPYRIVVMDDTRGYFIRDNALWVCEVEDDELVPASARPIDLVTIDSDKLKEVMAAVDTLNSEAKDLMEDEEE